MIKEKHLVRVDLLFERGMKMISKGTSLQRQKGAVLVLVSLGLVVFMGIAALAIDSSRAYVDKTRLQNMADALALSAAISLNKQESSVAIPDKEAYAENYARTNTFPKFTETIAANNPQAEQDSFKNIGLTFTFATTLGTTAGSPGDWAAAAGINGAKFARVVVSPMTLRTWFASIMGFDTMAVSASAVAGTVPIVPFCATNGTTEGSIAPIIMCAGNTNGSLDKDCNNNTNTSNGNSNNDCYGYELNVVYALKSSNWQASNIGPGNFGFYDMGSGGNDIRKCLAGNPVCTALMCSVLSSGTPPILNQTEPGNKVGPSSQGLNTAFDDFSGPINYCNSSSCSSVYAPDSIVTHSISTAGRTVGSEFATLSTPDNIYNSYYKANYKTGSDLTSGHTPIRGRRLTSITFINCPGYGLAGKSDYEAVGFGCMFLTSKATQGANSTIYGEFLGTEECNIGGSKTSSTANFGFYKVQLYKDPYSPES